MTQSAFVPLLKTSGAAPRSGQAAPDYVIQARSAGIQVLDVSGSFLANLMDASYPCRHEEGLRLPIL
jgi:hypothetical protein